MRSVIILVSVAALLAWAGASARADWPHDVKWDQLLPSDDYGAAAYWSTGGPAVIEATTADDFLCTETGWITDIEFTGFGTSILSFRVRFWTDVPETDEEASKPGQLLYDQTFDPAGPDGLGWKTLDDSTYKINIPEELWFPQEGSAANPTVYWISIQAIIDPAYYNDNFYWYFRDRNEATWGDDAVFASEYYGYDPWAHWGWETTDPSASPELYGYRLPAGWAASADMSFKLTGIAIPEPAMLALVGFGAALLGFVRSRRK